jgi:hypothetical protein
MAQYFKSLGLALLLPVGVGSLGQAASSEGLDPYLEVFDELFSIDIFGGDLTLEILRKLQIILGD